MAEFVTKDAAAIETMRAIYADAMERYGRDHNGEWAVLGQVHLLPLGRLAIDTDSVRVKASLLSPYWAQEINKVLRRMNASKRRSEKRKAKTAKAKSK